MQQRRITQQSVPYYAPAEKERPAITVTSGAAVDNFHTSLTVGPSGPILLGDYALLDKLGHFNRERIPERVVHAKGAGAHGYFEVTHDITKYCKAAFLHTIGKRTPVFLRFSTVGYEKGSADTGRDPRGFAIKFYTEEGNWDMVGNNTPVFFIRDGMKFPDFIHTQKKNPRTNLPDPNMFWDFLSLEPESIHQVLILFSNRGTPQGYRHMNGYGSHSYKMVNRDGEVFYVKFHFKTNQGIKNFTAEEATAIAGTDPDYSTRDLFEAIEKKNFPSWTFYIQVMPFNEAKSYKWDVLDITKVWPHKDYPLIPVGQLVLNRNPDNYFVETEESAFAPSHLIPGIEPSEDKMLHARLFGYTDAHLHRLGANSHLIPVNSPLKAPAGDYNIRDGPMNVSPNSPSWPNYSPNSIFSSPADQPSVKASEYPINGMVGRYTIHVTDADFVQPRELYQKVMPKKEQDALIHNITLSLKNARKDIQERQLNVFSRVDPELSRRIAQAIGFPSARL